MQLRSSATYLIFAAMSCLFLTSIAAGQKEPSNHTLSVRRSSAVRLDRSPTGRPEPRRGQFEILRPITIYYPKYGAPRAQEKANVDASRRPIVEKKNTLSLEPITIHYRVPGTRDVTAGRGAVRTEQGNTEVPVKAEKLAVAVPAKQPALGNPTVEAVAIDVKIPEASEPAKSASALGRDQGAAAVSAAKAPPVSPPSAFTVGETATESKPAGPSTEIQNETNPVPAESAAVTPLAPKLVPQPETIAPPSQSAAQLGGTSFVTVEAENKHATNFVPAATNVAVESQATAATAAISEEPVAPSKLSVIDLNNSAITLTREARYEEAAQLLRQAIGAAPKLSGLHRNLSIVYENMKRLDEALASAKYAVELAPREAPALVQLCGLQLFTGNNIEALACYEKLNDIKPLEALSQTFYGVALLRLSRLPEALTVLEKAAAGGRRNPATLNALGVAYYNSKRYTEAAAAFKGAVELHPDRSELRFNLALAYIALRNKEGALSQYRILKTEDEKLAGKLYRLLFSDKVIFVDQLKTN